MNGRWPTAVRVLAPAVLILAGQLIFFPMPVGAMTSGAILGLVTALAAIGMALIWRANRIVNFAQADLGIFPATLTVLLVLLAGLPWLLSVFIGLATAFVLGLLVDLLVIRRFFRSPRLMLTVATLALSQILSFGALFLPRAWGEGPEIRPFDPPFEWTMTFGGVIFDGADLLAVIIAPLVMIGVGAFLRFSDTGVALRAAADSSDRALMLGIPVRRLEATVWTLATLMSFVAVLLIAGISDLRFGPGVGVLVIVQVLAALVLGRMTELTTIILSSVALGVLASGIRWNTGEEYLLPPILAAIIVAALLLQRRGVTRADRDDTSSWEAAEWVRPVPAAVRRIGEVRFARAAVIALVAAAVVIAPAFMGTNGQLKAGVIAIFGLIGVSIVVLTGWAGQVSLGQMAFVGVGAAIGAATMDAWGWDPFLAMMVSGPAGAIVAVIVGLPALRLRGLFLAMTTLALSVAASAWIFSNKIGQWIPDGSFKRTELFGAIDIATPLRLYYFALATFAIVALGLLGVRRSRTGRVLQALRDNETGVMAYGVNPVRAKLTAFALSGWIAAIAGVVLVYHQSAFRSVSYSPYESIGVFTATVIGGLGALSGGPIGAMFAWGAQWLLPAPWSFLVVGLGAILVLTALPGGLGSAIWAMRDAYLRSAARRHGVHSLALDRTSAVVGDETNGSGTAIETATRPDASPGASPEDDVIEASR